MKPVLVETIKVVIGLVLLAADAAVVVVKKFKNLKRKRNV